MKLKILLIHPPAGISTNEISLPLYTAPPLGLAYIAAVLEKNGIDVSILDGYQLKCTKEMLSRFVNKERPDIIGITALTPFIKDALEVAKISKDVLPNVKVVIGGPHATALPHEVASNPYVDFACYGEGEYTMLELTKTISNGKDFGDIKGIAYKKNATVVINPPRPFIEDLDSLPFPAYHLLLMGRFNPKHHWGKGSQWVSMVTGRGCPFRCIFCAEHKILGPKHRFRSAKNVIEEIEYLRERFGIRYLTFEDSTFTINKDRLEELCRSIIEKGMDIKWNCNSRVDTLPDENVLRLMKKAGCIAISFGVESGNPEILKKVKHVTIQEVKNAIKRTKSAGIQAHCSFIFGLPGETKSTIRDTISFAKVLDPDTIGFHLLVPNPGTEIFNRYEKEGVIITKDWSKYAKEPVIATEELSPDYLRQIRIEAYKEFYLRPSYILRRLLKTRGLSELKDYVCIGKNLLIKDNLMVGLRGR